MISSSNCVWMKIVPGIAGIVSLSAVLTVPSWAGESRQMVRAVEESLVSQSDSVETMEAEPAEIESVDVAPSDAGSVEVESVEVEVPADGTPGVDSVEVSPSDSGSLEIEAVEPEIIEPEASEPEVMDDTSEITEPEATDDALDLETSETEPLSAEPMSEEEVAPQSSEAVPSEATPSTQSSSDISENELQQFAATIPQLVTIEQTGQEQILQVIDQSGLEQDRFYEIYQSQGQPTAETEAIATPEEQSSFETALAQIEEIEQDVASQQQDVISASGIEPDRFNQIMDTVLSDPQLQLEVQELMVQ